MANLVCLAPEEVPSTCQCFALRIPLRVKLPDTYPARLYQRACSDPLSRAAPSLNQPVTMGVPSPCVSRRVGDPVFAQRKRSVRVVLLLFLTRLIACSSLKRALHQARSPWCIPASPLQTCCGGCGRHRTELGFDNPSLTMRTGLAGRSRTCLPQIPALSACSCPLWLSPLGQPLSWRSFCSQPPFPLGRISSAPTRRTPRTHLAL